MFGIKSKDISLLENKINEAFDIIIGKRNSNRFETLNFSDKKLQSISELINSRIKEFVLKDQNDMLTMGEFILALDHMKVGVIKKTNITGYSRETRIMATSFNELTAVLYEKFEAITTILQSYTNSNFTQMLELENIKGEMADLITGINNLRETITVMLKDSLQNGSELQRDSLSLKDAVESLSTSANEQAASLEETAAAMEEMASNVQNNVHKSNSMASMAIETDKAAKEGAALALRTSVAMTDIQKATASINEAVTIIENIAFQTNILSLNAAVEAATAGDAGKGFAVVAQEVRNLANRSADAAKEIKAMALSATAKSNDGLAISGELTKGFETIAQKIEQTTILVQDVSNANREQLLGIEQINTAITQLDQMTQQNAKIASEADSIANATMNKASIMVQDASSKEFIGKDEVRRKNEERSQKAEARRVQTSSTKKPSSSLKQSSDVWESF